MSEPEDLPDVNAESVLALVQAENDYRSAMVGPVSPEALPLLRAVQPGDEETGEAARQDPGELGR